MWLNMVADPKLQFSADHEYIYISWSNIWQPIILGQDFGVTREDSQWPWEQIVVVPQLSPLLLTVFISDLEIWRHVFPWNWFHDLLVFEALLVLFKI